MNQGEGRVRGQEHSWFARLTTSGLLATAIFLISSEGVSATESERPDVHALVRELGDVDFDVRQRAFERLMSWGARDPEGALATLPKEHDDPGTRAYLERLRREIPWNAISREVVRGIENPVVARLVEGALREAADTPYPQFREGSGRAAVTAAWGSQNPVLWKLRNTPTPESQEAARHVAQAFLRHPDNRTLWIAASTYFVMGSRPLPEALFPRVAAFLDDDDPDVRMAGWGLLVQANQTALATRLLEAALKDPSFHVRAKALELLAAPGFGNDGTALAILPCLEDPALDGGPTPEGNAARFARQSACRTIARLKAPDSVKPVAALLEHARAPVREAAAVTLGLMGREAVDPSRTVPLLFARIEKEPDPQAREAVLLALGRLKEESAIGLFRKILDDPNEHLRVRRLVHGALKSMGVEAPFPEPGVMLDAGAAGAVDVPLPEKPVERRKPK